ncbi:3-isopropylmalate dehydratase [Candidatus Fermentibacteria bacterium]|nr:3-isopropylmalate dehydratase [Candidatus Fermentibacteria bacterium]
MRETLLSGRLWVLQSDGRLLDDIDTDMIYHNEHLAVTEVSEMGKHALGNLEGYRDFAEKVERGDMVLAGKNFGAGSSRQHAVDCFISLGVQAVLARSFGAIYKRNAINSGFPVMEVPEATADTFEHLNEVEVDLKRGLVSCGDTTLGGVPLSEVAMDIYRAGGLFEYAERMS